MSFVTYVFGNGHRKACSKHQITSLVCEKREKTDEKRIKAAQQTNKNTK